MMRGVSLRRFAVPLIVVPVLASCGDSGGATAADASSADVAPTTVEADAEPTLAAFVEFPRYLQLKRTVEVAISNSGDDAVLVESVDLDSSVFTDAGPTTADSTVGAGRRRDLRVPLGDPVCDTLDPATATATAHVVIGTAAASTSIDLELDPTPLLDIADDECGRARVFEAADIAFGDEWTVDDGVLTAPIAMSVLGEAPVTLEQVAGSVIFVVEAADPAPGTTDRVEVTVDADAPTAEVPIRIRAERCEPHAVAESKKTFVFPIWVRVADDETRYVTIEPDTPLRNALQQLIDECQRALASVPK